jgi:hypothetical protein
MAAAIALLIAFEVRSVNTLRRLGFLAAQSSFPQPSTTSKI